MPRAIFLFAPVIFSASQVCDWAEEGSVFCRYAALLKDNAVTGVAPCWTHPTAKERCCGARAIRGGPWNDKESWQWLECFNDLFTEAECCSHGHVLLEPLAGSPLRTALQPQLLPLGPHPALSKEQRRWESAVALATVTASCEVSLPLPLKGKLTLKMRAFKLDSPFTHGGSHWRGKSAGSHLCEVFQKDEYGFVRAAAAAKSLKDGSKVSSESPREGEVFVDVGANIGWNAVLMAKLHAEQGVKIIAVEPNWGSYRYLLWNLRANNVTDSVIPIHAGVVADGPELPGRMWIERCAPWGLFLCLSRTSQLKGLEELQHQQSDMVATVSLPHLLRQFAPLGPVSVIKADCEGCEWPLFGVAAGGTGKPVDKGLAVLEARGLRRVVGELHELRGGEMKGGSCVFQGAAELRKFLHSRSLVAGPVCQGGRPCSECL